MILDCEQNLNNLLLMQNIRLRYTGEICGRSFRHSGVRGRRTRLL